MGHDHGLWCGIDARSFKILILSGIPDAQTNMSISPKGSHAIKIEKLNTAGNIHNALLVGFTPVHTLQRNDWSVDQFLYLRNLLL